MMPYSLVGVYQYLEEQAASTFYPDKGVTTISHSLPLYYCLALEIFQMEGNHTSKNSRHSGCVQRGEREICITNKVMYIHSASISLQS